MRASDRQRDQVRRALVRRINELPTAGFAEFIATWLNAQGVVSLRAVRLPGSRGNQLHFAGTLKRGAEETRLAIVVQRDGSSIDREGVIAVRGAMHHFGNATTAWMISTGRITSGAREEATANGANPCALYDGTAMTESMERLGIGVKRHAVPVTSIDFDLFDALTDKSDSRGKEGSDRKGRSRRGRSRDGAESGESERDRAHPGDDIDEASAAPDENESETNADGFEGDETAESDRAETSGETGSVTPDAESGDPENDMQPEPEMTETPPEANAAEPEAAGEEAAGEEAAGEEAAGDEAAGEEAAGEEAAGTDVAEDAAVDRDDETTES
jgi:hypothetical protein